MENADIESATHEFYQGKFFQGVIQFKARANFLLIKEQLERRFGTAPKSTRERLVWDWPKVKITLYYNQKKESGSVTYSYQPMLKQKLVDKKIRQKMERASHYTE